MAFFSLFKNQRTPRGFQLQHRYYDERKERLEQLGSKEPQSAEARKERLHQAWSAKRTTATSGRGQFVRMVGIAVGLLVLASLLLR